ncbi:MAG: RsmF rRNA methyltransferase first C-terminal domain-containing protein [Lachnospiraceae bacterium]|nr:RsmF rRNA methyltransferase first C-terminal domain-containing protein [Lachnospiraceae bacterium]
MINLPKDFEIRMQDMLKDAYPDFVRSYDGKKCQALRVNTLKTGVEEFLEKQSFFDRESARRVPWESRGFYYEETAQPGKHPFHEAGVYYIQEPSAMLPVSLLGAGPNEKILDLCAAPGGKSTQIASYMENKGFLLCNEIHPARAKILSQNIERMGIKNALVTNETPQKLSELFGEYFDRILVDAPCSGEGMFRKNEEAIGEWSLENVRLCAERQAAILDCADLMLRAGGTLVYSTCTFSREENEENVEGFLQRHPGYELIRMERLYPHMAEGEGHFAAVLKKGGDVPAGYQGFLQNGLQRGISIKDVKEFADFQNENLKNFESRLLEEGGERIVKFGGQLYLMPKGMPSVAGLKVLRAGLHLGEIKKNRFEPSHALALALKEDEAAHCMELCSDADKNDMSVTNLYLNGQTLVRQGEKGWYLMTCRGYSIGWGKLAGQVMKNHYPKGLRK